jgi:hypothetical protein
MSLVAGITLYLFGILTFYLEVKSLVWAGSFVIGILFILAAMVRLLLRGSLSAYRKVRNQNNNFVHLFPLNLTGAL